MARTRTAPQDGSARRSSATRRPTKTGRAPNGAGSVVARTLASGEVVYDVFRSYRDAAGTRKRAYACGFASAKEAEKHRRAVTATVDTGRYLPPQDMTLGEYLTESLDGLRLKPQTPCRRAA